MDIQIIKVDPNSRLVTMSLQPKIVTGLFKLVQIVVLSLLKTPDGRCVSFPDRGGGLLSLVGEYNIDDGVSNELFADVAQKVKKTQSEIIESQFGLNVGDNEKLLELHIMGIEQGSTVDQLFVKIRVVNQLGQISDIMV